MILDFLKFLGEAKAQYAFVATYEFDPLFFERRILLSKSFETADRIVVFMDDSRYRELLAQGRQGSQFDRRYFVIPVTCEQGVFHPKLYFAVGDRACIASVGSNNCTASGTGHNFELISTFKAKLSEENDSPNHALCASVFQLFQRMAQDAGQLAKTLEAKVFEPIEYAFPWLTHEYSASDSNGVEVLSNFDGSLWSQVMARLGNANIQKITLCAPYFDEGLSIVERTKSVWPNAKIEIVAQPNYSNLPSARLASLQEKFADVRLLSATPETAGRSVHAKALAFETPDETFWLTGSANISNAALVGGNREVCLWFSTKQQPFEVFVHDHLSLIPTDAEDFEELDITEPEQGPHATNGLQIHSVRLTDKGELCGTVQSPPNASELSVRLVRLREQHPFLVRPLVDDTRDFILRLGDEQCQSFDRPVLAYLQAKIEGETELSNPVSVAQLARLLHNREGGGAAGNRLNRIADTGEGIVEYADTLHGVDEAIDFYRNVNIRFDDGAIYGGHTAPKWRGRDPFTGDVPESWLLGSSGGSVTELRDAIWDFFERHVTGKLQKHVARGNLNGLSNFMDIFRTLTGLLLTYHHRQLGGVTVIPAPFATNGLQQVLTALIGTMPVNETSFFQASHESDVSPGFIRSVHQNLGANDALLIDQLDRQRVAATAMATVDELIRVRCIAQNKTQEDRWSLARRKWVSEWLTTLGLETPNDADLKEVGAEFRLAA